MNRPVVFPDTRNLFVLFAGLLSVPAIASADPISTRGATLAYACAACHGPDGRSQGAIPPLDRLSPEHFREAMHAFRTGGRQGTVMNRIAKGLSDTDIEAVTAYFASVEQSQQE